MMAADVKSTTISLFLTDHSMMRLSMVGVSLVLG
jgi:hypothetical protein